MDTRQSDGPPAAFTTLWTREQCRRLISAGMVGRPVRLTFGGAHTSAPRFSRAGVRHGDLVYPINVQAGRLLVLARFRVADLVAAASFVARSSQRFADIEPGDEAPLRLARWIASDPELEALCPGEADEVVITTESTPITLDAIVPRQRVFELRWQSGRRPERPIKHLDAAGRITKVISLQGVYRVTTPTAAILDATLARALGPSTAPADPA